MWQNYENAQHNFLNFLQFLSFFFFLKILLYFHISEEEQQIFPTEQLEPLTVWHFCLRTHLNTDSIIEIAPLINSSTNCFIEDWSTLNTVCLYPSFLTKLGRFWTEPGHSDRMKPPVGEVDTLWKGTQMFLLLKIQKLLCWSQCICVRVGGPEKCRKIWKETRKVACVTSSSLPLYVLLLLLSHYPV